jgi:hypothetical protein
MFVVVCVNTVVQSNCDRAFQLDLWPNFLAGRVPRRKNFAGSFKKDIFTPSNKEFLMRRLIHKEKQF